jgi:flagellar basal-body rod protein FlgC
MSTMDYSQVFAISAAGMALERTRVEVTALNLANAHTVQTPGAPHYQPMRVVGRTVPAAVASAPGFAQAVGNFMAQASGAVGLPLASVEPADVPSRLVYEPGNPFANAKGFVAYPGVDSATEMVNMMSALRSYEANVIAMNTAKTLALRALDIGGQNA